MSNASLKEQLQAMASQLTDKYELGEQVSKMKKKLLPKGKTNKPKPKWLEYVLYGVELLKAYFPHCFKPSSEVRPLKKGIKQDLVKFLSTVDTIVMEDKACMVKTLAYYVNTSAYHRSVIEGAPRIDLDGNPVGVVTAEEAKYSVLRQQTKQQARQAASSNQPTKPKEEVTL